MSRSFIAWIAVFVTAVASASKADASPFWFEWQGNNGYSAVGSFGFDPLTAPTIINESGAGPTNVLDFLSVAFLDPSHIVMQTSNTVVGGVSNSSFFAFNFDASTNQLFGAFNVGGGAVAAGVQFFNGSVGGLLRLRENVDASGTSIVLDSQDPGVIAVTAVPEPGTLILTALGLAAISRKAFRGRSPR